MVDAPLPTRGRASDAVPLAWSLVGHVVAVAALVVLLREAAPPPLPPAYAVSLVAAPAGPRRVATAPQTAPAAAPAAAEPPAAAAPPAPTGAAVAPRPTPASTPTRPEQAAPRPGRAATPAAPAAPSSTRPAAPTTGAATPAGGGPTGDTGSDVVSVRTTGVAFPYPGYLENIVRQIALNFRPRAGSALRADVAFTIQRDGTVADIRMVAKSGNYGFDLECLGAVEAVGQRRGFGPLPAGFRDDALPVVFSFDPRTLR
jgi:protein TonB